MVIWPSCSNSASARPAARAMTRAPGAATTSMATVLSASTAPRSKAAAVAARMRSRGPPSASSTVTRDGPKPVVGEQPRQRRRRRAVRGQRDHPRAGMEMRAHEIERAAMQRDERRLRQRPAEPRGGEAEGRRRRHDQHLLRIDLPRQHRADAVHERIAGGEHADLRGRAAPAPRATAPSNGDGHGRAAPRISGAASARWRLPPNTNSAPLTRPRATAPRPSMPSSPMPTMDSQRGDAAVSGTRSASAMKRILILGGTTEARRLAERLAVARRPRGDAVARRPHRRAGRAAGAGAGRRLRRRRRARRIARRRRRSTC